jgi:hypothetical protein
MKSVQAALVTVAVVVVVALGVVLYLVNSGPAPAGSSTPTIIVTTSTMRLPATAYDEGATRAGDAAPHENENNGELQPGDLTDEERQHLNELGSLLTPTLEQVRASGTITPESVTAALVAIGFPAGDVSAVPRTSSIGTPTQFVVFGIAVDNGCVSGMVSADQVQAVAMGRIPEWGCIPPDTH